MKYANIIYKNNYFSQQVSCILPFNRGHTNVRKGLRSALSKAFSNQSFPWGSPIHSENPIILNSDDGTSLREIYHIGDATVQVDVHLERERTYVSTRAISRFYGDVEKVCKAWQEVFVASEKIK